MALDLDSARAVVEQREREQIEHLAAERERLVLEEAYRQEHEAAARETGRALIAGQERHKQFRSQQHQAARAKARDALDALKAATAGREQAAERVARRRAEEQQQQRQLAAHPPLDQDEYPNQQEQQAWNERHAQLVEAARRYQTQIASEQQTLDAAVLAEQHALDVFRVAQAEELRLRNEL
jgi:hypothetical protein